MKTRKYLRGLGMGMGMATVLGGASWAWAEDAEPVANTDEIVLKSGSKILGSVVDSRDGVVTIETDFAGTLSIELDKIASMHTANPVQIQLADETVLAEQPLLVQDEKLVVNTTTSAAQSYDLDQLLLVNPQPWELGQGYRWTGLASVAMSRLRGNTDTDDMTFNAESIWRSREDRYTLRYNSDKEKADNETTVSNWYGQGKYDYFLDGPMYTGIQGSAEHDKFSDLDLRYVIGPFIGRQFYEEPVFSFSGEVGVAYVNEDFIEASDRDYPAANWALDMSSNYLGGDSRLYFNNRGIWNLDETGNYIVNTTMGLAFPLLWSLEAAAEVLLDYDAGAVDGVEKLDQTYRFRVGYTW